MDRKAMLALLDELLRCHSPPGEEGEVDAVVRRELEATGLEVWQDGATNLYARLPGSGPKVMACAHKDEIGMVVSKIEPDGRLRVAPCGGAYPWKYGEGPVDVLADDGSTVRGVLSAGSIHTRSGPLHELKRARALTWDLTSVFTGLGADELAKRGVHVGSRASVARERKGLQQLGDYIGAFALDDRLGIVALLAALQELVDAGAALDADLYAVVTHGEELGMLGALRAAAHIRPDVCVALDTSPVTPEVPVALDARPVIWYRETTFNDKALCDSLRRLTDELGCGAQPCLYDAAASDAGRVKQHGLADRTACFGFARENSHGFEIAHAESLPNVTRLLVEFLRGLG